MVLNDLYTRYRDTTNHCHLPQKSDAWSAGAFATALGHNSVCMTGSLSASLGVSTRHCSARGADTARQARPLALSSARALEVTMHFGAFFYGTVDMPDAGVDGPPAHRRHYG